MIERGVLAGATMLLAMLVGLAAAAASTNPAPEIASREEVRRIVVQEAMRSRSVARPWPWRSPRWNLTSTPLPKAAPAPAGSCN